MAETTPAKLPDLHDHDARRRCAACGYDVRGLGSIVCPECGAPINWQRFVITQPAVREKAVKVLSATRIDVRRIDPHPVCGATLRSAGAPPSPEGSIWLPAHQANEAIEALDAAGIVIQLPIIDVGESVCPTCASAISVEQGGICGVCGSVFQLIDVEYLPQRRPGHRRQRPGKDVEPSLDEAARDQVSVPKRVSSLLGVPMMLTALLLAWLALLAVNKGMDWLAVLPSILALLLGVAGCWMLSPRSDRT